MRMYYGGLTFYIMYVHVCNLCINHRCISNVGMLNQPSGNIAALGIVPTVRVVTNA